MSAAMTIPGNTADPFLVHFFGTGLADERYVVEKFHARADGDIEKLGRERIEIVRDANPLAAMAVWE